MTGRNGADRETVDYLRDRGLLPQATVTRLAGGVSGDTRLVEVLPERLVVKRALGQLRVDGVWRAKPERAMTEAAAIELLHGLTPEYTPRLCDTDPERHTIVMTAAPADWTPWRDVLLGTTVDTSSGLLATTTVLGLVLAAWHRNTWRDPSIAARFDDYEAFDQLRITPFHRAVALVHPGAARRIDALADELCEARDCLVHGDFSPKNVLVGRGGLMVLDFEVAHVGAPVLDVAFLWCHLALKAMHLPHRAKRLAEAAGVFLETYREGTDAPPVERLAWHTAALLLARVDGLSPAGYLTGTTAAAVRQVALDVLGAADPQPHDLWQRILENN